MKFRNIQALSVGSVFSMWVIKFAMHPMHMHTTMLFAALAVAIVSEVSYRAGKKEKEEDLVKATR